MDTDVGRSPASQGRAATPSEPSPAVSGKAGIPNAGFTPGPHEAEPADHLGAHAYAIKASDGDYLAVGCTLGDAYLFAAAPELYEAAQTVLDGLNARIDAADPSSDLVFAGIAALHAALAKARGEVA